MKESIRKAAMLSLAVMLMQMLVMFAETFKTVSLDSASSDVLCVGTIMFLVSELFKCFDASTSGHSVPPGVVIVGCLIVTLGVMQFVAHTDIPDRIFLKETALIVDSSVVLGLAALSARDFLPAKQEEISASRMRWYYGGLFVILSGLQVPLIYVAASAVF